MEVKPELSLLITYELSCHTQLRAPQPPKDSPKPRAMSRVLVRKTRAPDDHSTGARVAMAKLLPKSAVPQPLDYTGNSKRCKKNPIDLVEGFKLH